MTRIATCTWAPTALSGPRLTGGGGQSELATLEGAEAVERLLAPVRHAEALGIDNLLVAQRWWGTGEEIEGSTYDAIAMTGFYAARTERIRLITAVHPGFFLPGPIAKWGATLSRVTGGRWAINVTSGWHEAEFAMYGVDWLDHDARYERSKEFIEIIRGAWAEGPFDYAGEHFRVRGLVVDPPPAGLLEVFQGGQSEAALGMAATHSDWMFLNGGPIEKIAGIIERVRALASARGRTVRFALYAIPLCRRGDDEAEAAVAAMVARIDPSRVAQRRERVSGAEGMWAPSDDPLTTLDSNEGFASRLIGSPETVWRRILAFHEAGVEMFHLALHDELFNAEVLPRIQRHG